jgi:hypothetical protein
MMVIKEHILTNFMDSSTLFPLHLQRENEMYAPVLTNTTGLTIDETTGCLRIRYREQPPFIDTENVGALWEYYSGYGTDYHYLTFGKICIEGIVLLLRIVHMTNSVSNNYHVKSPTLKLGVTWLEVPAMIRAIEQLDPSTEEFTFNARVPVTIDPFEAPPTEPTIKEITLHGLDKAANRTALLELLKHVLRLTI